MSYLTLPRVRRVSQIVFFALFLLLLRTEFLASLPAATGNAPLPYPVSIFLQSDPLVSISNALSTHALYKGLLWSLMILIPTFFLGRFFCGWICPLGTLNHFFSNLKSERKRGKQLIESNRYKRWQTLKYYLLIALLVMALFGGQFLAILDPISLTVRSLGLSLSAGDRITASMRCWTDFTGVHVARCGLQRTFSISFCKRRCSASSSPIFARGSSWELSSSRSWR